LREHTSLPIILKGILHPDDALRAVDAGMDGLIVSNHGGRQVDGALSSIEALPRIVEAVGPDVTLLLDSGVRSGADMYKALALGASAVCIGRPYAYALAIAGQTGVEAVIRNLLADFELTMRLSGKRSIAEVKDDFLIPRS
jgi:lactate 2-monooxygenase